MKSIKLFTTIMVCMVISIGSLSASQAHGVSDTIAPRSTVVMPPPQAGLDVKKGIKVREQEMPQFPGCESSLHAGAKEQCSYEKLLNYIYTNLKYPAKAKESGLEGGVIVQFVIDIDGSITDVKIVRDIGLGCGQAAMDVVLSMNQMEEKWIPGKQKGVPVKVLYTLPVKFKL